MDLEGIIPRQIPIVHDLYEIWHQLKSMTIDEESLMVARVWVKRVKSEDLDFHIR